MSPIGDGSVNTTWKSGTGSSSAARASIHVHMRMMRHRRSPAVQHGGDADSGAEMLGVSRDREHRLGGRPEQEIVNHRLVLIGDIADWRWQCEDHVEVW